MKGLLILSGLVVAVAGGAVAIRNLSDDGTATAQSTALDCALRENSWRWACNMVKDPVDLEKPGPREPEKPSESAPAPAVAKNSSDPITTGSIAPRAVATGEAVAKSAEAPHTAAAGEEASKTPKPTPESNRRANAELLLPPDEEIVADEPPAEPASQDKPVTASVTLDKPAVERGESGRRLDAAAASSAAVTSPDVDKERTSQAVDDERPQKKPNATLRNSRSRKDMKQTREARPSAPARTRSATRERPRPTRERTAPTMAAEIAAGRLKVIPPGYAQIVRGSDGNYYAIPIAR